MTLFAGNAVSLRRLGVVVLLGAIGGWILVAGGRSVSEAREQAPSKRLEFVLRHAEGSTRLAGRVVTKWQGQTGFPATLRLRKVPCPGRYLISIRVFVAAHLSRQVDYAAGLEGMRFNGTEVDCSVFQNADEGSSGEGLEDWAQAHREIGVAIVRPDPPEGEVAHYSGRRVPATEDFRGTLTLPGPPCPGQFRLKLHSEWADGSNAFTLIYGFRLGRMTIDGRSARCSDGEQFSSARF